MADVDAPETTDISLDEWERRELLGYVAGKFLTYLGHYEGAGLFRGEVDEMNRLGRLSHKIKPRGKPYEDLPYRGFRRNGFNPDAD